MESTGKTACGVLVVSGSVKSAEAICAALPKERFAPVPLCLDGDRTAQSIIQAPEPFVVLNAPLAGLSETALAMELARDPARGVLLLVTADAYEKTCALVEDAGVLTLPKPGSARMLLVALQLLVATHNRLAALERKTQSLTTKMEDIKLINRAKWVLFEQLKMDEPTAHHYIERQAMNQHRTRREVAQSILMTYEYY